MLGSASASCAIVILVQVTRRPNAGVFCLQPRLRGHQRVSIHGPVFDMRLQFEAFHDERAQHQKEGIDIEAAYPRRRRSYPSRVIPLMSIRPPGRKPPPLPGPMAFGSLGLMSATSNSVGGRATHGQCIVELEIPRTFQPGFIHQRIGADELLRQRHGVHVFSQRRHGHVAALERKRGQGRGGGARRVIGRSAAAVGQTLDIQLTSAGAPRALGFFKLLLRGWRRRERWPPHRSGPAWRPNGFHNARRGRIPLS